jgi:hypothetical protein
MIQGVVNARHETVVRLRVSGPAGTEPGGDAIIDTGFRVLGGGFQAVPVVRWLDDSKASSHWLVAL